MTIKPSFLQLLSVSPFSILKKHMTVTQSCVKELEAVYEATYQQDFKTVQALHENIVHAEHAADHLKKDFRAHLHRDLLLPIPRNELLKLMHLQDKIANEAKDISGLIIERSLIIPTSLHPLFKQLVSETCHTYNMAYQSSILLSKLVKTVFSKKVRKNICGSLDQLDAYEQQTDQTQHQLRCLLFSVEQEYPPLEVMCLYRLIHYTGQLADHAQNIGNHLIEIIAH